VTLALGLIYHLKHLVLALDNLYEVTRDLLILETAIMPPEKTPEPFQHSLGRLHPLAYIENPAAAKEQVYNWFLPSPSALVALLQNTGFDEVELVEVKNERAVAACRKHQTRSRTDVRHHYVAAITFLDGPVTCRAREALSFRLRVENIGLERWPSQPQEDNERGVVHLASHLLRANEEEVAWDYARANLPDDIDPGDSVEIEIQTIAPDEPADYLIEFDLVAEHLAWFEDFGSGTLRHPLRVNN